MRALILVLLLGLPAAARAASLDGIWTTGCMPEGEASRITTLVLGPESAGIRTNLYRDSHCADHKGLEHVQGRYEPAASSLRFIPAATGFLIYTRQSLAQAYRQHACGIDAWPPMAEQPVSGMDHCLGLTIPQPDVPLMVEVGREGDRLILQGGFGTAGRLHRIEAGNTSRRRPQRYGTQGHCVATGRWEPFPSEDDGRLDERRKDVGLEPMAVYIAGAGKLCN